MYDQLNDTDWDVFYFVKEWNESHSYSPSVHDMSAALERSTGLINYSLRQLQSAGLIVRQPTRLYKLRVVLEAVEERG